MIGLPLAVLSVIFSLIAFAVPFILAENPGIDAKRALRLSYDMTLGEKGNMFLLNLSFLGWLLLGAVACGVGVLFVIPYIYATQAELYGALRIKAVRCGLCTNQEIGLELF